MLVWVAQTLKCQNTEFSLFPNKKRNGAGAGVKKAAFVGGGGVACEGEDSELFSSHG